MIREQMVEICRRLNQKNLLAAADGNISYRNSDQDILITPTGKNKAHIESKDMAQITLDNKILVGQPSSERLMHLEIFKNCPKAKAIVHAHPPTAIAWTIAFPQDKELPCDGMSELILALGSVPIAPYARPGTQAMGDVLKAFLPQHRVLILARHGAISWGEDLEEAYNGMERLEHVAGILKSAVQMKGLSSLPAEEVQALRELRQKIGERSL